MKTLSWRSPLLRLAFLLPHTLAGEEAIERLIDLGRLAEARARLSALTGEPDRAALLESMILYREGKPAASLAGLAPILENSRRSSSSGATVATFAAAHKLAALSLVALGRPAEAGPHIVEAVRLAPKDFMARYYLGLHQLDKRQPEQAAATFEEAVRLNPDYPDTHTMLGLAREQSGRDAEALASYRQAVELTARLRIKRESAYVYLGRYLHSRGAHDEAALHLEAAVSANPKSTEAWLLLGRTRSALARHTAALEALQRAAGLAPRDKRVRFQLMQAYQRGGRLDEARREKQIYEALSDSELGRWEEHVAGAARGGETPTRRE